MKKLRYLLISFKDRRKEMKANTLGSLSLLNMQTSLLIIGILICGGAFMVLLLKSSYLKIVSVAILGMLIANLWRIGRKGLKK